MHYILDVFVIAQVIGFICLLLDIIVTQVNSSKKVLIVNGTSNILYALQYYLLGSIPGAVISIIAGLRNLVFGKYKNKKIPFYIFLIYSIIIIIFSYIFWDHKFLSIIPTINVLLFSYSLYKNDIVFIKQVYILVAILGMIYNYAVMAYVSILDEIMCLLFAIYGLYKYNEENKKKNIKRKVTKKKKKRKRDYK